MRDELKRFLTTATENVRKAYNPGDEIDKRNARIAKAIKKRLEGATAVNIAVELEVILNTAPGTISGLVETGSTMIEYEVGTTIKVKDKVDDFDGCLVGTVIVCTDPECNEFGYPDDCDVTYIDNVTQRRKHVKFLTPAEINSYVDNLTTRQYRELVEVLDLDSDC